MVEQLIRDTACPDDRVAPVVEVDELGQELCAHPEAVAGDPIDDDLEPGSSRSVNVRRSTTARESHHATFRSGRARAASDGSREQLPRR
jgi:hypothetical protein